VTSSHEYGRYSQPLVGSVTVVFFLCFIYVTIFAGFLTCHATKLARQVNDLMLGTLHSK